MNPGPLAAWVAAALSGGTIGTLATGWVNRRKTSAEAAKLQAEARKVEAEARKVDADADATRADTADHLIATLRAQVDRQGAERVTDRQELAELRAALDAVRKATEECEAHRATYRAELAANRAELAELKAANAGLRTRLEELEHDLHRRARTTGDGR